VEKHFTISVGDSGRSVKAFAE